MMAAATASTRFDKGPPQIVVNSTAKRLSAVMVAACRFTTVSPAACHPRLILTVAFCSHCQHG